MVWDVAIVKARSSIAVPPSTVSLTGRADICCWFVLLSTGNTWLLLFTLPVAQWFMLTPSRKASYKMIICVGGFPIEIQIKIRYLMIRTKNKVSHFGFNFNRKSVVNLVYHISRYSFSNLSKIANSWLRRPRNFMPFLAILTYFFRILTTLFGQFSSNQLWSTKISYKCKN